MSWCTVPVHNIYAIVVQENMTRMLMVTDVQDIIKRHQAQIITSLKDPDIRLHVLSCVLKSLILYIIIELFACQIQILFITYDCTCMYTLW